ncbi:signal transduction histidine kinase [Mycolicibacterium iranicum]|uniref:Signal transduction histidine kinase n=1 Tax=Mycolicibacterium iranicum TaxID=912594 RepID=A0A839PWL7_MYCIR|nr:CHASE3 domain-containing protein [Mycolicibacterium iranicum]MBB2988628.1 signal transduction histidine kinase [Mycolicibacterium iranicum]
MATGAEAQKPSLKRLIWTSLGAMTAVFLIVLIASISARLAVARSFAHLNQHVIPVQNNIAEARRAYIDQETGERGYLLTGNPVSLEPYRAGAATAERVVGDLREALADDETGRDLLDRASATASRWTQSIAEPQIAARGAGPIPPDQQAVMDLDGKAVFDQLRRDLQELADYSDEMHAAQMRQIATVQRVANAVQILGAAALLSVVLWSVLMVQRRLTRPVNTLVETVKTVADGDYDEPIQREGPREIAAIAEAVEEMRDSLRASTERLVDSELRDEQARIAADLHDRVIQQVFGLGLGLTSAATRRNPDLEPFIDETDVIIRDLREVVFNLNHAVAKPGRSAGVRAAVIDVVESSVRALGFVPSLHFEGPVDEMPIQPALHAAVLAVVREALSNVARHSEATAASVSVAVTSDELTVTVSDNGTGLSGDDVLGDGRRNIEFRARQFGGRAVIDNAPAGPGTVVEWAVPLAGAVHTKGLDRSRT